MNKTFSTYVNKYDMRIAIYNQSCYDYDLTPNESCLCIKATIDNKEYVIGHGYKAKRLTIRVAKTITDLFLIKTCVYKITKLENRSVISEMIYNGERHFCNRINSEKKVIEKSNSEVEFDDIHTVDPSIIDSLK